MRAHQQHVLAPGCILKGEKTFRGVVHLVIAHIRAGDQTTVNILVRSESDPSVHEKFQVGPHLADMVRAGILQHFFQQNQHPRGNARDGGNVPPHDLLHHAGQFFVPVGQQSRPAIRSGTPVGPLRRPAHQNSRQVAGKQPRVVRRLQAAPQTQRIPAEHPRIRMVAQIGAHQVVGRQEMALPQGFFGNGDVFALGVGRTGGLRKITYRAGPYHVAFAAQTAFHIGMKRLVRPHRHRLCEIGVRHSGPQAVFAAETGSGAAGNEV